MAFAYSRWNMEINDEKKIILLGLLHYNNAIPNVVSVKVTNTLIL